MEKKKSQTNKYIPLKNYYKLEYISEAADMLRKYQLHLSY